MPRTLQETIHLLVRHSNLSARSADELLREKVYSDKKAGQQFLRLLLLTLGVGFTAAGIIFFFAYNWAELHKFAKLGLIAVLLIATTGFAIAPKTDTTLQRFSLTASALLVGVLFAVYGQIYQTGANAYDFFLAWTACITLWVVVARFAPLWLLYLLLIHVTLILYSIQVAREWSAVWVCTLLFLLQSVALLGSLSLPRFGAKGAPVWFTQTIALSVAGYATVGILYGIFSDPEPSLFVLTGCSVLTYAWMTWYGWKSKNAFYPALTAGSFLAILCGLIFKIFDENAAFLLVSMVLIGGVTLIVKTLLHLQKKWSHD